VRAPWRREPLDRAGWRGGGAAAGGRRRGELRVARRSLWFIFILPRARRGGRLALWSRRSKEHGARAALSSAQAEGGRRRVAVADARLSQWLNDPLQREFFLA
jgi:hypothetical protein